MTDVLPEMAAQLAAAGVIPRNGIIADGLLHRCGTEGKPHGSDASYKAFVDPPASLWWMNWRTGDEGTWTAKADKGLTASERKTLRKRIKATKAEAKAEQQRRWAAAAKVATNLWGKAVPAGEHPYLQRKDVPALGLRQAADGRLLVPVMDEQGKVQSLQFIADDGSKRFLKGGRTAGGYFPIPAKSGSEDGPLLIAEGFATTATLHTATGYACLVAFNAGNLEAVARQAREAFPGRELVLCGDNDAETAHPDGTPWNPGKEAASRAAQAVRGKVALCPAHEGKATDFNDLHQSHSLEAVKAVIENARKQSDACPMPEGFFLVKEGKRAGLYKLETKPDGENKEIRLGPPLLVKGMTRDTDGNEWGLMLAWHDPDGKEHLWPMPIDLLFRPNGDWYSVLASGGWFGDPSTRKKLMEFLAAVRPVRRIRCVGRTGWDCNAYVLPDAVYGETTGEEVVLQSRHHAGLYRCAGTLEDWKEIPALAVGNSRLSFALCAAFAGPLLHLAGLEGGGFSFEGGSSSGKTTALQIAASVWGGPEQVRSWRTTDNGLEGTAALHNDNVLFLDELGQVNGRVAAECPYLLSSGRGKARSDRNGQARRPQTWRLLFLSSGELGLADKLAEAGLRTRAGQEVRFVGLPVDKTMVSELHGLPDAGAVVNRIKELASEHYGHAGRAFLKELTDPEGLAALRTELPSQLAALVERLVPAQADGQVRRVAQRFALCVLAGDMAEQIGLLPSGFNPLTCAETCFRDWLAARGGSGASEDAAILASMRLFIEQHGASRFQDLDAPASTCINRVGFRQRKDRDATEFVILPEAFRAEVVKGFSERRAAQVLAEAGWLQRGQAGRLKTQRRLPDLGQVRAYVVVLPTDKEQD